MAHTRQLMHGTCLTQDIVTYTRHCTSQSCTTYTTHTHDPHSTRSVQAGHIHFTCTQAHAACRLQIAMSHVRQMSNTCTAHAHISITLTRRTAFDTCMGCVRHMRGTCTTYVIICTVYTCIMHGTSMTGAYVRHTHSRYSEMLTLQARVLISLTLAIH